MGSVKLDVQWSPIHANKFITWGTEICLYEVTQIKENIRQLCEYMYISRQEIHKILITLLLSSLYRYKDF